METNSYKNIDFITSKYTITCKDCENIFKLSGAQAEIIVKRNEMKRWNMA